MQIRDLLIMHTHIGRYAVHNDLKVFIHIYGSNILTLCRNYSYQLPQSICFLQLRPQMLPQLHWSRRTMDKT